MRESDIKMYVNKNEVKKMSLYAYTITACEFFSLSRARASLGRLSLEAH